jgi:hypothetical protein
MKMYRVSRLRAQSLSHALGALGVLAALLPTAACGLVKSDGADFNLDISDKIFSIDASSWQVNNDNAAAFLAIPCGAQSLCEDAASHACQNTGTCGGTCGGNNTCELALSIDLWRVVDLPQDQPKLSSLTTSSFDITLDGISYEVLANSLNVLTPALTVYVAPVSVIAAAGAVEIGTIDPVSPGATTAAPHELEFVSGGRDALVGALQAYQTPFNVIVAASITVGSGDTLPDGVLDAVIHLDAHASP